MAITIKRGETPTLRLKEKDKGSLSNIDALRLTIEQDDVELKKTVLKADFKVDDNGFTYADFNYTQEDTLSLSEGNAEIQWRAYTDMNKVKENIIDKVKVLEALDETVWDGSNEGDQ